MPNHEVLIDKNSPHLKNRQKAQQAYFSTIDLKNAYSYLQLHEDTTEHCSFNIICRESPGTYRFYSLTAMPARFQKAMDYTFIGLQKTFCI